MNHHVWIMIAKELLAHGDITHAKTLLNDALEHAKILQEMTNIV